MRIGLDARSSHREGVGRYIKELIYHLGKIDRKNNYIVYVSHEQRNDIELPDNFTSLMTAPQTKLSKIIAFGKIIERSNLDVFHALDHWYIPFSTSCPILSTFHDLMVKTNPWTLSLKARTYARIATRLAVKLSSRIITVSEFNKNEILKYYQFNADNISVIYHGVSENFHPLRDKSHSHVKEKYGVPSDFFFYAGSLRRYKNVSTLIESYSLLPSEIQTKHHLVIAARHEHEYIHLKSMVDSLNLNGKIHFVGFLNQKDLLNSYCNSIAFITLSLSESFCLPIIEAMACGAPVIAPNNLSFPEITKNNALLIDPTNSKGVAYRMSEIITNRHLREELSMKGLEISKYYSWIENAKEVKSLYERFADQ